MRIGLQVIPDCPNTSGARELLREACAAVGLDAAPEETVVAGPGDAERLGFAGSPSFTANGRDLFPSSGRAGYTCRVYPGANGPAGLPTKDELVDALTRALAR